MRYGWILQRQVGNDDRFVAEDGYGYIYRENIMEAKVWRTRNYARKRKFVDEQILKVELNENGEPIKIIGRL